MLARTAFQLFTYATPRSTDSVLLKEKEVYGSGSQKRMPCTLRPCLSTASILHTRTGGPSVYTPVSSFGFPLHW
ncbi:hypothetical protein J6590_068163, partial [Homalodisca vitripennis]